MWRGMSPVCKSLPERTGGGLAPHAALPPRIFAELGSASLGQIVLAALSVSEVEGMSARAPRAFHVQHIRAQSLRQLRDFAALAMARAIG